MKKIAIILAATFLCSCQASKSNILFYDSNNFALSVSSAPTNGTPEVILGYKSNSVALVPAQPDNLTESMVSGMSETKDGESKSGQYDQYFDAERHNEDGNTNKDALSVFASFTSDSRNSNRGFGRLFATGLAAQELAANYFEDQTAIEPTP